MRSPLFLSAPIRLAHLSFARYRVKRVGCRTSKSIRLISHEVLRSRTLSGSRLCRYHSSRSLSAGLLRNSRPGRGRRHGGIGRRDSPCTGSGSHPRRWVPPHSSVIILTSSRIVSISENFGGRARSAVSDTATESNVTDRRPVQDGFPVQSGWIGLPPSYLSEMG